MVESQALLLGLKKGTLLYVKSPPYYTKEYLYEVVGAGEKKVRASLYRSTKVRKAWTIEELKLLFEMGLVRLAEAHEIKDNS